jgi:RND family efflux transporter MFP subunit
MKKLLSLALIHTTLLAAPTLVPVQKGGLERPYPIVGTFSPFHETKIGTQVNGRVKNIFVKMGDRVQKGQVLVELDSVFLEIELKRQTALFDLAQAGYEETRADYERLKPLWEKNPPSISKKSFEDAEIRCKQKKALLDQASADLENTRQRLRETQIVAPYDGVVAKRNVDYGEAVTTMPAITVAEIIDDSHLVLEFSLPQDLLEKVKNQTKVRLEIPGGRQVYDGAISTVSPQLEKDTRTFLCQVVIDNLDGAIHAGSFVKGTVYCLPNPSHFHAKKEAFIEKGSQWFAKVDENGTVVLKPVDVAFTSDLEIEIAQGLKENDQLVIE